MSQDGDDGRKHMGVGARQRWGRPPRHQQRNRSHLLKQAFQPRCRRKQSICRGPRPSALLQPPSPPGRGHTGGGAVRYPRRELGRGSPLQAAGGRGIVIFAGPLLVLVLPVLLLIPVPRPCT